MIEWNFENNWLSIEKWEFVEHFQELDYEVETNMKMIREKE